MTDKIYYGDETGRHEATGKILEQILKDRADAQEAQSRIEAEMQAKQATLESAIAKLSKLGLTEDEAKAIIGIQ